MTFRPLHDRILVRRIDADEKRLAALSSPTLPRKSRRKARLSPLVRGARDDSGQLPPLDVKVGDRILFGKWSGTEIRLNGEDLLIMKEFDVMGVIEATSRLRKAA